MPFCTGCGQQMKHFGPGTNKAGKSYNASWRCPGSCKGTVVWIKDGEGQPSPSGPVNGSGSNGGGTRSADPTGRSIEAQAACKAACEAFAGAAAHIGLTTPAGQHEWIVALASRLVLDVIQPAVAGTLAPYVSAGQEDPEGLPF